MVHRWRAALFSLFHYFHIQLNRRCQILCQWHTFNCCASFCAMWVFISWDFCALLYSPFTKQYYVLNWSLSALHSPGALWQVCLSSWHLFTCFDEEQGHFVSIDKQEDDFVVLDFFWWQVPHHHYSAQTMLLGAKWLYKVIIGVKASLTVMSPSDLSLRHALLLITYMTLKADEAIYFSSMKCPFCLWRRLVMRNSALPPLSLVD